MIENIRSAYRLISTIKVSGDAVDYMAMARQQLREAEKKALEASGVPRAMTLADGEEETDGRDNSD